MSDDYPEGLKTADMCLFCPLITVGIVGSQTCCLEEGAASDKCLASRREMVLYKKREREKAQQV